MDEKQTNSKWTFNPPEVKTIELEFLFFGKESERGFKNLMEDSKKLWTKVTTVAKDKYCTNCGKKFDEVL